MAQRMLGYAKDWKYFDSLQDDPIYSRPHPPPHLLLPSPTPKKKKD